MAAAPAVPLRAGEEGTRAKHDAWNRDVVKACADETASAESEANETAKATLLGLVAVRGGGGSAGARSKQRTNETE